MRGWVSTRSSARSSPRRAGGGRGRGDGQGQRRRLLRRRHRAARRPDRHRQELAAHARGLGGRAERRQAALPHTRRDPPAHAQRHGVDRRHEEGHPEDEGRQPRSRRDADRARHQRDHQPGGPAAVEQLTKLAGCEFHTTHLPTAGDEAGLRRLGVNATSDPQFATRSLVIG